MRIQTIVDMARLNSGNSRGSQVHPGSQGIQLAGSSESQQPGQSGVSEAARSNNDISAYAKIMKKRKLVSKLNAICT